MAYGTGDETIDLTEPTWVEPLTFPEADERRLHMRAYHHWTSLRRDRLLPDPADLRPERLGALADHAVIAELTGATPVLRHVGRRLRREAGLGGDDVLPLAGVPASSVLARLTDHLADAVDRRAPVRFETEFVSARGCETLSRGVLMPLSQGGERVDAVFGVINWREVAAPELAGRLATEIAAVLRSRAG